MSSPADRHTTFPALMTQHLDRPWKLTKKQPSAIPTAKRLPTRSRPSAGWCGVEPLRMAAATAPPTEPSALPRSTRAQRLAWCVLAPHFRTSVHTAVEMRTCIAARHVAMACHGHTHAHALTVTSLKASCPCARYTGLQAFYAQLTAVIRHAKTRVQDC